jgi:hypothetical protein
MRVLNNNFHAPRERKIINDDYDSPKQYVQIESHVIHIQVTSSSFSDGKNIRRYVCSLLLEVGLEIESRPFFSQCKLLL